MVQQQPVKRGRGRPRGSKTQKKTFRDESGPQWAIVDYLALIHDDIKGLNKLLAFEVQKMEVKDG
jgi:hypothetical protein